MHASRRRPITLPVVLRWVTAFLGALAFFYVVGVLLTQWRSAQAIPQAVSPGGILCAFLASTASLWLIAATWYWVLRRAGIEVTPTDAMQAWFTGNLYKYIPGQIWMAVGRTLKGTQLGVPARASLATTIAEQGLSVLIAAFLLCLATERMFPAAMLAGVSVVLLQPRMLNRGILLLNRVMRHPLAPIPLSTTQLALLYLVNVANLALAAVALSAVIAAVGVFRLAEFPTYVTALTASFLSGYLFFGAPAGLGIREGVLLVTLGRAGLAPAEGALVAILLRLTVVIAELVSFAAVSVLASRQRIRRGSPP